MSVTELSSIEDLDSVLAGSSDKPVILFKHSTRCPISVMAHQQYETFIASGEAGTVTCTYLDLLKHRDVSAAIADKTGVVHQSPQAILVVGGEAKWSASHHEITNEALKGAVEGL